MYPPHDPQDILVEGVMTTLASDAGDAPHVDGSAANVAPMGPIVDPAFTRFVLRPFRTSTTYRNLKATGCGVFHITDDVDLIARAALGRVQPGGELPWRPAQTVRGVVLTGTCRYYELSVVELDDREERTRIVARPLHARRLRDFVGFHRARHAVLEAAILATRLHLTGPEPVLAELKRLQVAVEKTGGDAERAAMARVREHVEAAARRDTGGIEQR